MTIPQGAPVPRISAAAAERKRDAILDAALALFAERGFHGTAVPEIARVARVGAGTIYRYFESKEDLVNALYRTWKARLGEWILDEFPWDREPREQFREFWGRLGSFAEAHPAALVFLEHHHHVAYLDAETRLMDAQVRGPLLEFFAHTRGSLTRDIPAELLIGIIMGSFARLIRLHHQGVINLDGQMLDEAEEAVWAAIRKPG
jgi:AcrR family transcriptional regulator